MQPLQQFVSLQAAQKMVSGPFSHPWPDDTNFLDISICLKAKADGVKEGDALHLTYSPTTTGEFFIHSGFIPENIESDASKIRITLPKGKIRILEISDKFISRKRRLAVGINVTASYQKSFQSWTRNNSSQSYQFYSNLFNEWRNCKSKIWGHENCPKGTFYKRRCVFPMVIWPTFRME